MNDLFGDLLDQPINILPRDGVVEYYGDVFEQLLADKYFEYFFENILWQQDQAIVHGKHYLTKRKVAWYGDKPFLYTYSNTTKQALAWNKYLIQVKTKIEQITSETYNSCLLNLYHNGSEGMAWHSDAEKDLKRNGAVASVSFGAERMFAFKHKRDKKTVSLNLTNGSLIVMK